MTDHSDLIARIEAGTADQQRELLIEAGRLVFDDRQGRNDDGRKWSAFCAMLDAEAYESAALMLVPEGLVWCVLTDFGLPGRARLWGSVLPGQADSGWTADGATPALAICAAALSAKETDHA